MAKKKLEVKVNLWAPNPSPDGELPIKGAVVHPANKSKDIHFKDVDELITILKEFNKTNIDWDKPSKPIKPGPYKGLPFIVILEPYDDNQPELQGLIRHADKARYPDAKVDCFCSNDKLKHIIANWHGEYLEPI